jgi:hypothetical protein
MRIRIRNFYADPDPDPAAQINADPDPDPKPCLKCWIRVRVEIYADPQHWSLAGLTVSKNPWVLVGTRYLPVVCL